MKVLYKPFGLIVSVLGGLLAGMLFKRVWSAVAHEEHAPKPKDASSGWGEVVGAAALQGAVVGGVKALVDRAGAKGFEHATGTWPA